MNNPKEVSKEHNYLSYGKLSYGMSNSTKIKLLNSMKVIYTNNLIIDPEKEYKEKNK
mgnify:CR=1 FL=1